MRIWNVKPSLKNFTESADRRDVLPGGLETGAHRIHADVRRPKSAPRIDARRPVLARHCVNADPGINSELSWVASRFLQESMQLRDIVFRRLIRRSAGRHPTVAETSRTSQLGLGRTSEPDGNRLLY